MQAVLIVDNRRAAGLGHVRRSLVLAKALRSTGWHCAFEATDPSVSEMIEGAGFKCLAINSNRESAPRLVCFDGYVFDVDAYARERNWGSLVLTIDDLAQNPVPADIVLNHNLYGGELDYSGYGAQRVLAGATYALIEHAFVELAQRPRSSDPRILVSFGGSDDGRFGRPVAEVILNAHPAAIVDLVIAPTADQSDIGNLDGSFNGRFRIHKGADMHSLMGTATHYAGAAGVTLMEAAAAGLRIVATAIADNQLINIAMLTKLGIPAFERFEPTAMGDAVLAPQSEANGLRNLIDGNGADRVVKECERLLVETAS